MASPVPMPQLSPTMTEGKILRWLKQEGEQVSAGQPIAEVETDKANLEMEAFEDGYLLKVLVPEGSSAKVGATIAFVGARGEKLPAVSQPERVRASPLARKIAQERGVELRMLQGTGPQGRIVQRDVELALIPKPVAAPELVPLERRAPEAVPLSSMRRIIAQRMTLAKPGIPHFYLTVEVEMDAALEVRGEGEALGSKVSVNDLIVKAAAVALRRCPKLNVQLSGEKLLQLQSVDVGVAVALEEGLFTPLIRDADRKGLGAIAAEARELAARARRRALKPEEYQGGSITVSNLGMYGVDAFVAIINPPQASILAVGAVAPRPVAREGQVVVRQMMSVTLSGDHRVVDGAVGAEYLRELKALLEHPLRLLW